MTPSVGYQISVCLLTYNHVELIDSTLQSILNQTVTGYQLIVSDDCSSDGTWERILALAAQDERIQPVRTPRNLGMSGNANFVVAQCTRPYIALLHHDDLYREDLLEKWAGVLERHPDAAFVFNSYGPAWRKDRFIESNPGELTEGRWLLENFLFPFWDCVVRGTAMIRHEAWLQVGGMREQFSLLADIDLWMRLAMRWGVGYVPEPVITVRQQRPIYYSDAYKGESLSWLRQRYLYEIHACNRLHYLQLNTWQGRLQWWKFRLRLSLETTKWLIYAVIKPKPNMIATCDEGVCEYELWPVGALRWIIKSVWRSSLA